MNETLLNTEGKCRDSRNFERFNYKVVVLDDDPTGTQTVKDLNVYTDWDETLIRDGFASDNNMFYIMTNSRAFSEEKTVSVHREIIRNIDKISEETDQPYLVISRGDSTLRGHSYVEPKAINDASSRGFDAVFHIPAFFEGGRYTYGGVHYLRDGDGVFIPIHESEFSNDPTFAFEAADMKGYVAEKSNHQISREQVKHIPLETLRSCNEGELLETFGMLQDFDQVIVDAVTDDDLNFFTATLMKFLQGTNKKFLFRTAASFVKSICSTPGELLDLENIIDEDAIRGGLVIVGSHVDKTTSQLHHLIDNGNIEPLEFDVEKVRNDDVLEDYIDQLKEYAEEMMGEGRSVVIFTSRKLIKTNDRYESLEISKKISESLVEIVSGLDIKPRFIIAKGGITSSDVATIGLGIRKARVLGQAAAGIPVWETMKEAKYPQMPYIIFPGNVGNIETLLTVFNKLIKME